MQIKLEIKSFLASLVILFALLFKYIGLWSYLFIKDYVKLKIILVIITFLMFLILYFLKIPIKEFKRIVVLGILILTVTMITGAIDLFISYLFAICYFSCKDGINKFINTFFYCSLTLFLFTLFMDIIGILPSNNSYRNIDGILYIRKNLGFPGINSLFLCLTPIILSFWIKYGNKMNRYKKYLISIIIFCVCLIFYRYTFSRTGFLCIIILLLFVNLPNILNNRFITYIFKFQYFIFAFFSIIIGIIFGENYNGVVNEVLSHRPYYWNYYISNMKISLFANRVVDSMPLDNTYLTYIYIYGIVSFLIISVLHIITFDRIKSNFYMYVALSVFAVYGLFENNFIYYQNFIFTIQLLLIIKSNKCEKKEEISYE